MEWGRGVCVVDCVDCVMHAVYVVCVRLRLGIVNTHA